MEIKEILQCAKDGSTTSKKFLYDRYTYIADKFYDQYKDYVSIKQIYDIYDRLFDKYFAENYPFGISFYMHKHYYNEIKPYIPEKVLLSEHISNAINGDKMAREELINHYSSIVANKAKEYDYLEYEELLQYGMIKLIEMIDSNLARGTTECWFGNLYRSIDIYLGRTLKSQVLEYNHGKENYSCRDINEMLMNKKCARYFSKMEVVDLIGSSNLTKKQRMYAFKYFVEGLPVRDIVDECECTRQAVSEQVGRASKKLARNFKSK